MPADQLSPTEIQTIVAAWQPFIEIQDWLSLINDVKPKSTNCGPVYELDGRSDRPNESFAIADMRDVAYAQPHYHANGETEIYFMLEGAGQVIVGNELNDVIKGSVVVIPPDAAHYTIPDKQAGLVLAVVNTPPFNPDNVVELVDSNERVKFDRDLFEKLTSE